ncbi:tetratricopeptide repeat protein [Defluviimonas aestuarii]|uniref:tetratricopeptide repeat protein n=1 Tax=Albidovulum aestuarii TaxID=1130726 RepID=UPI00249B6023|nr:tetratricopeptide repeat protein [Defluviimonas aestuarii]MDI3338668.1 tetratricopeptide repeat protein [Defluviimonas aestuarii]
MGLSKTIAVLTLTAGLTVLAACDSSEERAEKHYQSGLAYLQAGDVDRALVEFRNVFDLNGNHTEARRTYAEVERGRGNLRQAFSQYLRLIEQQPEDMDTARALAEIAAEGNDWETAARFSAKALEKAPGDAELTAIRIAADYGRAIVDNNVSVLIKAAAEARDLRKTIPDNLLLRRVVIDDLMRAQDYQDALEEIDLALEVAPDDRPLRAQRLQALAAVGDDAGVEAELRGLVARFPNAPEMATTLVRWFSSRQELDKAEEFLRSRIDPASPDQERVLNLVQFLAEQRGQPAAVAELEKIIVGDNAAPAYRATHAAFIFDLGRRDEAIAAMREILTTASPSVETRRTKIGLAKMLLITGDADGAHKLVDEVLADDAGEVEALKLKAGWLILDDAVGDAIAILRKAVDENPRDAAILTLMAQAYERDGNRDLVRESLSRAVEVANRAPDESLRYAQFLANEGKLLPAEGVLIDALRLSPGSMNLLTALGEVYLRVQDYPRATAVANALMSLESREAKLAAQNIQTAVVTGQEDTDKAVSYLEKLVEDGSGGLPARIAILRTHLDNGENEKARAYSSKLLESEPDNRNLRFIDASVRTLTGDAAGAEAILRDLVDADQQLLPAWISLIRIIASDDDRLNEASKLVAEALEVSPESGDLKWAKAGLLERQGDIPAAIAVYEEMYKDNSANPIIANNLASLLSNHYSDPDNIQRAEVIARRLRDSTVPAYQDTYGWIAFLRGDHDAALADLEKAAAALPDDPAVQYHLAMVYDATGRAPDALARFHKVLELVDADQKSPVGEKARQQVQRLEADGVTVGN